MIPLTQKQRDEKRTSVTFRIERALLAIIQRWAAKNKTTTKETIDSILREKFKYEKR